MIKKRRQKYEIDKQNATVHILLYLVKLMYDLWCWSSFTLVIVMNNPIVFVSKVVLVPMIKFESKANDPVVPFLRASF